MIRKTPRGGGGGAGGAGGVGVGPSLGAKEPASRKASGLAQLVSALHQNAAAVVNSKTQLNGPDQVGNHELHAYRVTHLVGKTSC